MLDVMRDGGGPSTSLLDFACGSGDLFRFIRSIGRSDIAYKGADISEITIDAARKKFPGVEFSQVDVLCTDDRQLQALASDYCVINGLFTVRAGMGESDMWGFVRRTVETLWPLMRRGLAFNVMSKQVDWERSDLFHVSFDQVAEFMHGIAGRNVAFRADYGLYEYTCYGFKEGFDQRASRRARLRRDPPAVPAPTTGLDLVCRPQLPTAERLEPRLRTIDRTRQYTNWGPLNGELEARLNAVLRLDGGECVSASSGTDAITAALIATAGRASPDRPYCLMPSYTFVATAIAAANAGYAPYLLDIDPVTLSLEPDRLSDHPLISKTGAVIAVAPYGAAVDASAWDRLSIEFGVPVVIDAAASFDAFASGRSTAPAGRTSIVLSLHATKAFGVGEGGLILCGDAGLARSCRSALNFGFLGDRVARMVGLNGKMSEYHAAVGLAALDEWPAKRSAFARVAQAYQSAAEGRPLPGRLLIERHVTGYALYLAESEAGAEAAQNCLRASGIDFRFWYGEGLHRHPAYEFVRVGSVAGDERRGASPDRPALLDRPSRRVREPGS